MALTGAMQPNEQLPSVRTLAKELMINPNTVQKAYQFLEQDGVIYSIPGKGSFISENIGISSKYREDVITRLTKLLEEGKAYGVTRKDIETVTNFIYKEEGENNASS